jgi:hypothetical protein
MVECDVNDAIGDFIDQLAKSFKIELPAGPLHPLISRLAQGTPQVASVRGLNVYNGRQAP